MKRISISSLHDEMALDIAYNIMADFPHYDWKIITPGQLSFWGQEKNEHVIIVNAGPVEALVAQPGKQPELTLKAWGNLTHGIMIPYISGFQEWNAKMIDDAKIFRAWQYLNTFGKQIPNMIVPRQDKEVNRKLIASLVANIEVIPPGKSHLIIRD